MSYSVTPQSYPHDCSYVKKVFQLASKTHSFSLQICSWRKEVNLMNGFKRSSQKDKTVEPDTEGRRWWFTVLWKYVSLHITHLPEHAHRYIFKHTHTSSMSIDLLETGQM